MIKSSAKFYYQKTCIKPDKYYIRTLKKKGKLLMSTSHVISSTTEIFIFSLQIYDAIYLCGYIYFLNYLRQRHNVPV